MKKLYIYTDFDGTITKKDIGDEIFKLFGKFEPFNSQLRQGILNIRDYWKILCNELDHNISFDDIYNFAINEEIDPYFPKFANFCFNEIIPLSIVSDGFDVYIEPILKKHNLDWINVFCNKLIKTDYNFQPFYIGASESCNCLSASCKRNYLISNTPPEYVIAYIGDGYSDFCAAEHSDIIFAKGELASYCSVNRIPHYPFNNFFDVLRILQDIIKKNKIKTRYQAYLKRENALKIE
jgi:2,3-diketo-5-methylthio-1-phosphopentane phosphatase